MKSKNWVIFSVSVGLILWALIVALIVVFSLSWLVLAVVFFVSILTIILCVGPKLEKRKKRSFNPALPEVKVDSSYPGAE